MLYLFICILHLAIEDVAAANYFLLVDDVAHSTSGEPEVSFQWGTQLLNSAGCYILVIVLYKKEEARLPLHNRNKSSTSSNYLKM